jgi:hypothetical protein
MIKYTFLEMYEPGEHAPPQFKFKNFLTTFPETVHVPLSYSDRVLYEDEEYFVYKIQHRIGEQWGNSVEYFLTKRVTYPIQGDTNV